jgi:hypothetical protein
MKPHIAFLFGNLLVLFRVVEMCSLPGTIIVSVSLVLSENKFRFSCQNLTPGSPHNYRGVHDQKLILAVSAELVAICN